MMTTRLRRFGLALLLGVLLTGTLQPSSDAALKVISGGCLIDLTAVRSSTEVEITTQTEGLCVTSDGNADATFTAPDLTPLVGSGCGAGVVDGGGAFDLVFNPFESLGWSNLDVVVAYADSAVQMEFRRNDSDGSILATGTFTQVPSSDPDCDSSQASFTWSGVLVFEDPVFE